MNTPSIDYMLGSITTRLDGIDERGDRMESAMAGQTTTLNEIKSFIDREKGARRLASVLAAGLGAVAGLAVSLFNRGG